MLKQLRKRNKGQTMMEYSLLVIIIIGAFLGISHYFKRGLSGRWKAAIDDLGDQYDPRATNADVIHRIEADTETRVSTINGTGGYWTLRTDFTNSIETKTGFLRTGGY